MTVKLYYQDPYQKTFATALVRQDQDAGGRWFAVLEETAFYPTGGGQPHDTGCLNKVRVIDVEEVDGEIRHYLDGELDGTGMVEGEIDWDRRFDHMQQHSAQHILSAAFDNLFLFRTVSFHLGREESTIDLDAEGFDESRLEAAEDLANRIVLENRPIETKWVTKEEAESLPLRKALSVEEDIRLVIIPDYDYNGCGGTHPSATGQVGMIKVLGVEKEKKKIRISFAAGKRAFEHFSRKHQVISKLSPLLNAPQEELEAAVQKLLQTKNQLEKQIEGLNGQLTAFEARELINQRFVDDGLVTGVFRDRPIQELQKLARAVLAEHEGKAVFLVAENGEKLQAVCARGQEAKGNMKEVLAHALNLINGKGGGNELFAQGGGEASMDGDALLDEIMKKFQR